MIWKPTVSTHYEKLNINISYPKVSIYSEFRRVARHMLIFLAPFKNDLNGFGRKAPKFMNVGKFI